MSLYPQFSALLKLIMSELRRMDIHKHIAIFQRKRACYIRIMKQLLRRCVSVLKEHNSLSRHLLNIDAF